MRGKKIEFLPNQKIGRLTVIKCLHKSCVSKNRGKRIVWLFKCDCGNEVEIPASDVVSRRKLSCGCLLKEHRLGCGKRISKLITKPNKDGPLTKLFGGYKRAASRRGYDWKLTKENFRKLISNKCFYCGHEPSSEIFIARKKTIDNTLIYNGVDRKNNTVGYTLDNSVTSCVVCNRMKMDLSYETFINQIKKIHDTIKL